MGKFKDLTGQRFGKLVAIERAANVSGRVAWKCQCDCGNERIIISKTLLNGNSKSCGCLRSENAYSQGLKNLMKGHSWIRDNDMYQGTRPSTLKPHVGKRNKSGVVGVSWDNSRNKWIAQISLANNHRHLGRFTNKQDAINARKAAEEKYFKPILEKYRKKV